jgi:hypothetical protein
MFDSFVDFFQRSRDVTIIGNAEENGAAPKKMLRIYLI